MLIKIITDLKEIGAEHLLQNKSQSYVVGVRSAWDAYNYILMLVPFNDIEMKIKMKLLLAYADREKAEDDEEETFQTGKIDFFKYILDHE